METERIFSEKGEEELGSQNTTTIPSLTSTSNQNGHPETNPSRFDKIMQNVYWSPPWCRWTRGKEPRFTMWHNIMFACAAGLSSANGYYSSPILNILAVDFNTSITGVSRIPTLAQAGAATGVLLILPLADVLPRRRFTITLVLMASVLWIPLCVTNNVQVFLAFTYLSATFNVAPQILIPLVSELSNDSNRALNIAVVASGNTLGILIGRILSGIVTEFTSWQNVYWIALAFQLGTLLTLYLFMPDYPATNRKTAKEIIREYPQSTWAIVTTFPKHPILVQASLISFFNFSSLTVYWTTLTFVLTGPIYSYDSIVVGLFGLVAILPMVSGPLYGEYIIKPLKQPMYSVLLGSLIALVGIVIGTYSGEKSIAALLIQGFLQDAALTIVQISNRISIHPVEPQARNRVSSGFVCVLYLGQVMGTYVGSIVYEDCGGWIASGSLGLGLCLACFVAVAWRGPHESGWLGWTGGWGIRSSLASKQGDVESAGDVVHVDAKREKD